MMLIFFSIAAALLTPINCDEKPMFYKNLTKSLLVNEGDSTQLECYASGPPDPHIKWQRYISYGDISNGTLPNGNVTFNGTVLKFPSITKDHRGRYICSAENGVGDPIQELFNLQVKSAPVITEINRQDLVGSEVKLGCEAKGNPPPGVTWYRNNKILSNSPEYHIMAGGWSNWNDRVDFFISISINDNDYNGIYKCIISNQLGEAEHSFEISDVE